MNIPGRRKQAIVLQVCGGTSLPRFIVIDAVSTLILCTSTQLIPRLPSVESRLLAMPWSALAVSLVRSASL
jgi:hypothetical protein